MRNPTGGYFGGWPAEGDQQAYRRVREFSSLPSPTPNLTQVRQRRSDGRRGEPVRCFAVKDSEDRLHTTPRTRRVEIQFSCEGVATGLRAKNTESTTTVHYRHKGPAEQFGRRTP